jgi:hypothetical protein
VADLVAAAKNRGCEGVWEGCGDSFTANYWMVWWVFKGALRKGGELIVCGFDNGLHQDSGFTEREVG